MRRVNPPSTTGFAAPTPNGFGMRRNLLVAVAAFCLVVTGAASATAQREVPRTGFEDRSGASWTTHEEELEFLAAVDRASPRVAIEKIGESEQGRPIHLVTVGAPRPGSSRHARGEPTILFVCSQHGNEPAGRETCLQVLRDLALTKQRTVVSLLADITIVFVPAANPDGSEANTRGNANGIDVNRDHLNLVTPEARAIARAVLRWKPDLVLDLHEYGPSAPVLYDDDVLYLWPRNLNVDAQVHSLSKAVALDYIAPQVEAAGYTADEYGLYAVGDQDVAQTAGDHDEGILRNAMGLRHALGILVESAVTPNPRHGPGEVTSEAEVNLRRVETQKIVAAAALDFMREQGDLARFATEGAPRRKTIEGRRRSEPVYFGGADNDPPEAGEIADPPPCGYLLAHADAARLVAVFDLLGIRRAASGEGTFVTMAQPAEPLVPLLLDERGERHAVAGRPLDDCAA